MSTKKVPYSPNKEASDPGEGGSSRPSRTPHSAAARANVREELSNNEFIVERIMGYRQINKVRYARVKWAGYPETTWEPANQIFLYQPSHKNGGKDRQAEFLVGRRVKKGRVEFKVHWAGFPAACDSWVRETALALLPHKDLIAKYLAEHPSTQPMKLTSQRSREPRGKKAISAHVGKAASAGSESSRSESGDLDAMEVETPKSSGRNGTLGYDSTPDLHSPSPTDISGPMLKIGEAAPYGIVEAKREAPVGMVKKEPVQRAVKIAPKPEPEPYIPPPPLLAVTVKPVALWTATDIAVFMREKGFPDAADKWEAKGVAGVGVTKYLDPSVMRASLGIPLGHCLKIAKLLKDLRNSKPAAMVPGAVLTIPAPDTASA